MTFDRMSLSVKHGRTDQPVPGRDHHFQVFGLSAGQRN
jgi:hypothetical protein